MSIHIEHLIGNVMSEMARRNPKQNPKIYAIDELEKYKDDANIFISFVDEDKLGIRPVNMWNSPTGLYSYSVKDMWDEISTNDIPYGGDRKYIWVFKPKENARLLDEVGTYSYQACEDDISILEELFVDIMGKDLFNTKLNIASAMAKSEYSFEVFWDLTKSLSGYLFQHPEKYKSFRDAKSAWRFILFKLLGYDGIIDRSGTELIHHNEAKQAVFFSTSVITPIEKILNRKMEEMKGIEDEEWFYDGK